MKIAFYYDSLVTVGGAERVIFKLAEELNADIITSGYDPKVKNILGSKKKIIDIGNFSIRIFKPLGILFEAPIRYLFARNTFKYDVHVFFGFTSFFAANPNNQNIYYCFSPNRMLYDMKEVKVNHSNTFLRIFFRFYNYIFYRYDQKIVKHSFQRILSQTNTVKERVKKYYNEDSTVIYSPVDTSMFHWKSYGNYYFTIARLFPEKRVDLIVRAFQKMPNAKLVIVGDGPEKIRIENMIRDFPNILLKSNLKDNEIVDLYAHCKATIFMAQNEDYGLVPLEGNASGKLCIAVNEGGCRETVIDNKTGFLIDPSVESLIKTIEKVNSLDLSQYKKDCIENSRRFDLSSIVEKWKKVLKTTHASS